MTSSRFQRMVVIPEQEYNQGRDMQQITQPLHSHASTLFKTYDQQGSINDPYSRVQRQAETLEEIMTLKDKIRGNLQRVTPRTFQSKAEKLMNFVIDKLQVNDKSELVNELSGEAIEGSNIYDLILHAVRDQRRNFIPFGWDFFKEKLTRANVPMSLLNYDTLDEIHQVNKVSIPKKITTSSSPSPVLTTIPIVSSPKKSIVKKSSIPKKSSIAKTSPQKLKTEPTAVTYAKPSVRSTVTTRSRSKINLDPSSAVLGDYAKNEWRVAGKKKKTSTSTDLQSY